MRLSLKLCAVVGVFFVAIQGTLTQGVSGQQPTANAATIIVTMTGRGKDAAPMAASDVTIRQDGKIRPVYSCEPAINQPLDLTVLIDDSLARNRGNRWDELQAFLRNQPANARETIAYANGKTIKFAQTSTSDHTLAAAAVVNPAANPAPRDVMYEAVEHLIDTWPAGSGRRVLLFVTRGFPRDYASTGIRPENSLPLRKLIEDAQRSGIIIYTIHSTPALADDPNPLTLLANETGGKQFVTGMEPGPSLERYLQEIEHQLEQQYSITFSAAPDAKSRFAALRIVTRTKPAELRYPARIYVGAN